MVLCGRSNASSALLRKQGARLTGRRWQVLGAVAIIARLNPGLALVAMALTPLLSRLTRLVVVRTARVAYRQQTAASDALKFADERLSQARVGIRFTREDERQALKALLGFRVKCADVCFSQACSSGGAVSLALCHEQEGRTN